MRRSPRSAFAFAAAVVVALVTLWVVGSDLRALHARAHDLGRVRHVAVAVRALPLGTKVRAGDVRVVARYASTLPPGAIDTSGAIGRVLALPVARGAVVQRAHLSATGFAGLVAPRQRAIRIHTDDGLVPERGAVVDVLAAFDPSVAAEPSAVTVATAARVLAVDASDTGSGATNGAGVTLLVTEAEAHSLAYAGANGVLILALAPPEAACC
jgi:Flp pilus assembly protein CpaB